MLCDLPVKFSVCVNEGQDKLPTMYWLPKLHERPYKARFIANSSSCTTTELSKLLTSCLTAIKSHVIRYCETVYETSNKNWFCSIKNSGEVLNKLKCRGFRATSLSTYDFSTLYTTLPHNLIKEKLLDLIEWTFKRALKNYGSLYLACNDRKAFFTSSDQSRYTLWSCQNVCDALSYLLDNIYIRFGTKLYRQIVGIPMGTNCTPLVADLFLYCYERDFMDSLNHDNQADVIEAFNSTSRCLSEPEFYGDLVYKFKKLIGCNDFSFQFRKIITRYRRIGYNLNVMRQSACLVFNPITVDNYAAFFNYTPVGRASDSMMAPT